MAILTCSPFLKADEIPDFLRALDSYTGSRLFQSATKLLMITGQEPLNYVRHCGQSLIWITLFGKFLLKG